VPLVSVTIPVMVFCAKRVRACGNKIAESKRNLFM